MRATDTTIFFFKIRTFSFVSRLPPGPLGLFYAVSHMPELQKPGKGTRLWKDGPTGRKSLSVDPNLNLRLRLQSSIPIFGGSFATCFPARVSSPTSSELRSEA